MNLGHRETSQCVSPGTAATSLARRRLETKSVGLIVEHAAEGQAAAESEQTKQELDAIDWDDDDS